MFKPSSDMQLMVSYPPNKTWQEGLEEVRANALGATKVQNPKPALSSIVHALESFDLGATLV